MYGLQCLEARLPNACQNGRLAARLRAPGRPLACRAAAALVTSGFTERLVDCCAAAALAYRGGSIQVGD